MTAEAVRGGGSASQTRHGCRPAAEVHSGRVRVSMSRPRRRPPEGRSSYPVRRNNRADRVRLEVGGWRLEVGRWRLEDGGWRLEDGGWEFPTSNLQPPASNLLLSLFLRRRTGVHRLRRVELDVVLCEGRADRGCLCEQRVR